MAAKKPSVAVIQGVLDALARDPNAHASATYAPNPHHVQATRQNPNLSDWANAPGAGVKLPGGGGGGFWNDLKGAGGHALKGALNAVGEPGAIVTSAINELGQLSKPGVDANGKRLKGGNASFHDFIKQAFGHVKDRVSADDILYGNAAKGISGPNNAFERRVAPKNKFARIGVDLGGSIASDPLTYIAPEEAFAHIGQGEAASRAAEAGGKAVQALGGTNTVAGAAKAAEVGDVVTRAARGGVSALTPAERVAYLGTKTGKGGLKLNVPGTGRLGRSVTNVGRKAVGAEKAHSAVQVPLIPEALTHPVTAALDKLTGKLGDVALGKNGSPTWLAEHLGGKGPDLKNAIRTGGDASAMDAANVLRVTRTQAQSEPRAAAELRQILMPPSKGLNATAKRDLVASLGGDTEAASRVADAHGATREAFDRIFQKMKAAGLNVRQHENYFPGVLSPEAKAALDIKQGGAFKSSTQFFERARTLTNPKEGDVKFLGGTVSGDTPEVRRLAADKILQEHIASNPKLAAELGDVKTTLFSNNLDAVLSTYATRAAKRIGEANAANRLADVGVGERGVAAPGPLRSALTAQGADAHTVQSLLAEKAAALGGAGDTAAALDAVPAAEHNLTDTISQLVDAGGSTSAAPDLGSTLKATGTNMVRALKDARNGLPQGGERLQAAIEDLTKLAGGSPQNVEQLLGVPKGLTTDVFDNLLDPNPRFDPLRKQLFEAAQSNVDRVAGEHSINADNAARTVEDVTGNHPARAASFTSDLSRLPNAPIQDQVQFASALRTDPAAAGAIVKNSEATTEHVRSVLAQALGRPPNDNELAAGSKVVAAVDQLDGARAVAAAQPDEQVKIVEQAAHEAAALHQAIADPHLLSTATPSVRRSITDAAANAEQRVQWGQTLAEATQSGDKPLGYVASLHQIAAQTEQRLIDAKQAALSYDYKLSSLSEPMTRQFTDLMKQQHSTGIKTMLADGVLTPADAAEAITRMDTKLTPTDMRAFFKKYDALVGYMKAGEIATPGFAFKLMFGHAWQNELAGMQFSSYRDFISLGRKVAKGAASPEEETLYKLADQATGVTEVGAEATHAHQLGTTATSEAKAGLGGHGTLNPLSRDFVGFHAAHATSNAVVRTMRGSLAYDNLVREGAVDAIKNGTDVSSLLDHAVAQVQKFHFDYFDLSPFERNVVKRVIPFYTFTRRNVPLQVEMLFRNPRVFNRYSQFKSAIEAQSSPDKVTPSYFSDELQIRLPFEVNGGHLYSNGALPLTDVAGLTDPSQLAGNVTPVIKAPIESWASKQFYEGIPFTGKLTPAAVVFETPGVKQALIASGYGKVGKNGQLYMTDKNQYLAEQFIPLLGRVRRLAPSDPKLQDKAIQSWITTVFGVSTRTNTLGQQVGQIEGQQIQAQNKKSNATKQRRQLGYQAPSQVTTNSVNAIERALRNQK